MVVDSAAHRIDRTVKVSIRFSHRIFRRPKFCTFELRSDLFHDVPECLDLGFSQHEGGSVVATLVRGDGAGENREHRRSARR